MMSNIEKTSKIKREKLNGEDYFSSLLEQAHSFGILNYSDILRLQNGTIELLNQKTKKYTNGESSSIKTSVAEALMQSVLYTTGLYLKSFDTPDEAAMALKKESLADAYTKGAKHISIKLRSLKQMHRMLLSSLIKTENYTFNATVKEGITGFFKLYDPEYFAQEIHITADYPIFNPVTGLLGIEFISKYLEALYYENMFCNHFSSESIESLLLKYDINYKNLIFNIYEQVLTCAIGCVIAKKDPRPLFLNAVDIEQIRFKLINSPDEQEKIIRMACLELFNIMEITGDSLQAYIKKSIQQISRNIIQSVSDDTLDKLFLLPSDSIPKEQIEYAAQSKMDDENYRAIIDKISSSATDGEKLTIIKCSVKSLEDLEDIIVDAELSQKVINAVFQTLEPIEVAVLVKKHPFTSGDFDADLGERELAIRKALQKYVLSLPIEQQVKIHSCLNSIKPSEN